MDHPLHDAAGMSAAAVISIGLSAGGLTIAGGYVTAAVGQNWFRIAQPQRVEPRIPVSLLPNEHPGVWNSLQQFAHMITQQAGVMTYADIFLVMAALCVAFMLMTLVLSVRTYPQRILFARK